MKAPFRISFNRLRLVGGDHKQIRGKQASNQYQQNNLWPFPSTPMNSILNIKKTNIRRNRIWVRIPRVTRNIPRQTRLHLILSRSSVFFLKTIPESLLSNILSYVYISAQKTQICSEKRKILSFLFFYVFVSASQKLNLPKEIHFPFFYFLSFSKIRMFFSFYVGSPLSI